MKKRFYLAAFAAMALVSCSEKNVEVQQIPVEDEVVELEVNVPIPLTRIAGVAQESDEKKVNDLQVFVFNSSGVLEAYGNEKASTLKLTCVPGEKSVVALVNAPSLSGIATLAELQGAKSMLSANDAGNLVMASGVLEKTLVADGDNSMTIEVTRLAAKVVLASVKNEMALEADRKKDFTIKAVYLTNVVGDRLYLSGSEPSVWYDKMGYEPDNTLSFLHDEPSYKLAYNTSYTSQHYFYCYPNSTETDAHAGSWSPRWTRLVVEAVLGTEKCYYPLSLPVVERNTEYVINLTVTRLGSSNPDTPVSTGEASFTVTVKDWEDGGERNEII